MTQAQFTETSGTATKSNWLSQGAMVAPLVAVSILFSSPQPTASATPFSGGLLQNPTLSRPLHMPGELQGEQHGNRQQLTERQRKIRALRGKYAHIPTSSEAFALSKKQEIERE